MSTRLKRTLLILLLVAATGTITLAVLWHNGTLKRWAQAKVVQLYLDKVQPHLPFQIEEADAQATWRELWDGRISRLSLVARWGDWRIRLSGPIHISRTYTVRYVPSTTIEPVRSFGSAADAERSTPLALDLMVRANKELNHLEEMEVFAHSPVFDWPYQGFHSRTPDLAAAWHDGIVEAGLTIQSFKWEPSKNHTLNLEKFSIHAHSQLALKPFSIGPEISFGWEGQHLETLWGETYLDLPLQPLPLRGNITLAKDPNGKLSPEKGAIDLGIAKSFSSPHVPLHLEGERTGQLLALKWKTQALPIHELLKGALDATGNGTGPFEFLTRLNDFDIRAGTLQTEGGATVPLGGEGHPNSLSHSPLKAEGILRLDNLAIQIHKARFAAKGLNVDLPFSTHFGVQGVVSAKDLYFRKLHGHLDPMEISLAPLESRESGESRGSSIFEKKGFRFHAGRAERPGNVGGDATLPLTIDEVPLQIGTVSGEFNALSSAPQGAPAGEPAAEVVPYRLETSLKLAPTRLVQLTWPMCVHGVRLPPATVEADLTHLAITPGNFDPNGQITFRLFDGKIRVGEIGIYDLFEDVPEVDFNLDFEGIQLGKLGDWLGFGEMIGSLQGYAHDVTFQKYLPTHFDLSFDAIPVNHWIEFSPEAMKNLVSLFAGGAVEKIPGIGSEALFGGLSHRLGGYDVKYAGLSLFANDGTILLETHDLPDVYYIMKKHYIFWGHRFKMPIESEHYPVVMDENGLTRIIRTMSAQISEMSRKKREKEPTHETPETDPNDPTCYPPRF